MTTISCSQKTVPFGLRKTINQLEENLNDTVKYDFRIAPESVAKAKHHFGLGLGLRNGKGLWSGSMLRTYFRLNGIKHPDDMSAIILSTLHRKLNDEPIEFRKQKRYYKKYWKIAKIEGDTLEKWWNAYNSKIESDSLEQVYFSNFKKNRLVLGTVGAWKKRENGGAIRDVKMIAKIIKLNDRKLKLKIVELDKADEGFELLEKVGDTIESDPYGVYLIPISEK